jgi:nucleoid DNA-binding protein
MKTKEYFIKKTSLQLSTSERIVESVISHQFQSASDAMETNHSVEISGFGKFLLNRPKAEKKYKELQFYIDKLEYNLLHPESTDRKPSWVKGVLERAKQQHSILKKVLSHEHLSDI